MLALFFLLSVCLDLLCVKEYNLVVGEPNVYITDETEKIGETWNSGTVWEKDLIELAYKKLKLQKGPFVFFDVGAQTGSFTLLSKYFPNSRWYAFEPIKEAAVELTKNLKLNDVYNVSVHQVAVSDSSGLATLKLPKNYNWGLSTLGGSPERFGNFIERKVKTISLDGFAKDNNIKNVNFIKIDIEGWELYALKGTRSLIKENMPIILMEFNLINLKQCGVDKDDVYKFLDDMGYEYKLVSNEDLLCLPKKTL